MELSSWWWWVNTVIVNYAYLIHVLLLSLWTWTPWYNRSGWLGVKHQATYSVKLYWMKTLPNVIDLCHRTWSRTWSSWFGDVAIIPWFDIKFIMIWIIIIMQITPADCWIIVQSNISSWWIANVMTLLLAFNWLRRGTDNSLVLFVVYVSFSLLILLLVLSLYDVWHCK